MPSRIPKPKAVPPSQPAPAAKPARSAKGAKPAPAAKAPKAGTPAKAPKPVTPIDPHRLVKRDGGYVSADGRFEVSGTPGSFYLADSARPNPFGLPTIDGPYRTLTELRAAVAAAVDDGGTRG